MWRTHLPVLMMAVLGALLVHAFSRSVPKPAPPALLPLDDWSVADMARYLEGRGLGLRAIPTSPKGYLGPNAFLVRRDFSWLELARLPKDAKRVHLWQGVAYFERWHNPLTAEDRAESWEGACLLAGPFLFFGDPELLAHIRDALSAAGPKTTKAAAGGRGMRENCVKRPVAVSPAPRKFRSGGSQGHCFPNRTPEVAPCAAFKGYLGWD
jgi:hypothetical protein